MTKKEQTDDPAQEAEAARRRALWNLRMGYLGAWVAVLVPFTYGLDQLARPTVQVRLDEGQREAVNGAFELSPARGTTVEEVTATLDGAGAVDRLVAATPSLLLAGALGLLAYALWRVLVNTSAGGGQRPFTEKDERYLLRAQRAMWTLWWGLTFMELFGYRALELDVNMGLWDGFAGPVSNGSLIVLGLGVALSAVRRAYRQGRKAYMELEKIV